MAPVAEPREPESPGVLAVRETRPPLKYEIPVVMQDPYHQPHLRNFFDAIRAKVALSCPADTGWSVTVAALKINEAIAAGRTLTFSTADFHL